MLRCVNSCCITSKRHITWFCNETETELFTFIYFLVATIHYAYSRHDHKISDIMGQQTLILTSHTHQRRTEFEINKSAKFILSHYQNMVFRVQHGYNGYHYNCHHTISISWDFSHFKSLESFLFLFICIHTFFVISN